jgi:mRNA-degrading endonuclease RelE of RelBE toxin-antitoxin system
MMRQVNLSKDAMKYLARLPRDSARKIVRAIKRVAAGKVEPHKIRKLSGRNQWRLRVGGQRVIYELESETKLLGVKIGPRGDVCK